MEIMVVLIIAGIAAAFFLPDYTIPIEQARAANAQNNLLAIYSAQQNYNNNNGGNGNYCYSAAGTASTACTTGSDNTCADSLAQINCNLSLNIQDDGTYTYFCAGGTCTAQRTSTGATIVLTLNSVINLSGSGIANPQCNLSNHWCP